MLGFGVLGSFLHDLLFCFVSGLKITVHADFTTFSTLDIAHVRADSIAKDASLKHVHAQHQVDQPEGDDGQDNVAHPLAGRFGIGVRHAPIVCGEDGVSLGNQGT